MKKSVNLVVANELKVSASNLGVNSNFVKTQIATLSANVNGNIFLNEKEAFSASMNIWSKSDI